METTVYVNLEHLVCSLCGVVFGLPPSLIQHRREDHETFYCPNGHTQYFPGKSEAEKLRDQLTAKQAELDRMQAARDDWRRHFETQERRTRAARGQVTKIKKRVGHGACPCCTKKFADLDAHMKAAHPWYGKEAAKEAE